MLLFEFVLLVANLLCALVAGFVFAFAVVVMPGIGKLADKEFIRAFQVIDGIIQAGQPLFGIVFMGSIATLLVSALTGALLLDGWLPAVVVSSAIAYFAGVLLPTFRINVPMNNVLQQLDTEVLDGRSLAAARGAFETRWVRWNAIRTVIATLVSATLMWVLLRL